MVILGHLAAVLIGVSLALIGGGGTILTVPVLVYLLTVSPALATTYSLFVVGATALIGSVNYAKQKLLDYKIAFIFGIPSIAAVFFTRIIIFPAIPEHFFSIGNFIVTRDLFIMLFFAVLMMGASFSMIRSGKFAENPDTPKTNFNYPLLILEGVVVGILTGFVGAGGGFLIIPALVLLAKLPMKKAIGTSLLIIAAKSLIGFTGDLGHTTIDWKFLFIFSAFAVGGIYIGVQLSRFISGQKLKPVFGWFVLAMGVYIVLKEIYLE